MRCALANWRPKQFLPEIIGSTPLLIAGFMLVASGLMRLPVGRLNIRP
jgi:hypothetical protein